MNVTLNTLYSHFLFPCIIYNSNLKCPFRCREFKDTLFFENGVEIPVSNCAFKRTQILYLIEGYLNFSTLIHTFYYTKENPFDGHVLTTLYLQHPDFMWRYLIHSLQHIPKYISNYRVFDAIGKKIGCSEIVSSYESLERK